MEIGKTALLTLILTAMVACTQESDIVVIGGGASGCSASIAAARLGSTVTLVEELPWLGGMLTSAGVSAVDGNYHMRSGIFGEFEQRIADYYGGWENLRTGWVSDVQFEPHVGEQILEDMVASERNITLCKETEFVKAEKLGTGWKVTVRELKSGSEKTIRCKVLLDCTELGDVAQGLGASYRLGFDAKSDTGERIAYDKAENIVQDLTIVAILKDFGPDADMTIPKPEGYNPDDFANCCINPMNNDEDRYRGRQQEVAAMMTYGRLPGGKIMLNWPIAGNDIYLNIVDMTPKERVKELEAARNKALGYVYFIQTTLGFKNYGLADDEFDTPDKLAYIPYHRESRRFKGEAFFTLEAIEKPYEYSFYRAACAVGDYPIDHHHYAHPEWERLELLPFYPVPSFSVPAGVIVPLDLEDFLIAEKSISVSNLANGATRLQPVVTQLGQTAGSVAAIAVRHGIAPRKVNIRELQTELLDAGMYIQPLLDLPKDDTDFKMLQRICSTGIMRSTGLSVDWENQSWFYTDREARICDLWLDEYYGIAHSDDETPLTRGVLAGIIEGIKGQTLEVADPEQVITRLEAARMIDTELSPFDARDVDWSGRLTEKVQE